MAADKERDRDWDNEMKEVDKLLSKLPAADPYLAGAPTVRKPAIGPLAWGAGSQMLQPLAIAVIGGVLISMILSLIITPAVHFYLSPKGERREQEPLAASE